MKKTILTLLSVIFSLSLIIAQETGDSTKIENELPKIDIKAMDGSTFNTSQISNPKGPIFLSFWATWCKPCIKELMAIDENYVDWEEELGLKVVAVSIDDVKSMSRVAPFINGRGWEYQILLDPNSDFKRAMNVVNVPHSFILDKTGKVVWQHTSFSPGDEDEIYKILKKVAAGEKLKIDKK